MGYDSEIKIKKRMIKDIANTFIDLGYKELNKKNTILPSIKQFSFYEDDNYKYFEGVLFAIYKTDNGYILAGRNSCFASDYDIIMHNRTLENISNKYNLVFSTDCGDCKLFVESRNPKEGMINGIYFPYWNVSNQLNMLKYFCDSIPKQTKQEKDMQKILGSVFQREIYGSNICIIHLVTILEMYFKNTFINIIKLTLSEEDIKKKFKLNSYSNRKYKSGEFSIYEAAANSCSFQNIESICKTFNNLDIDLETLFKNRRRYYEKLDLIFQHRHDSVHLLMTEAKYNYDKFLADSLTVERVINLTYRSLCKKCKVVCQK